MTEHNLYPVLCAWCHSVIEYTTVEGSHGICPECAVTLLQQSDQQRERRRQETLEELRRRYGVRR